MMTFINAAPILSDYRMTTLKQRVKWVLANRPGFRNQTDLARESGLSEGFFGPALSREKKDPTFQISIEAARMVGEKADVDPHWFRTGEGVPDASVMAQYDTHEMRRWAALLAAQIEGIDPQKAFWVIGGVELSNPTREAFLIEGIKRLRAGEPQTVELTEEKVRGFTAQFARQLKQQS
jgi:hypothetical protein